MKRLRDLGLRLLALYLVLLGLTQLVGLRFEGLYPIMGLLALLAGAALLIGRR